MATFWSSKIEVPGRGNGSKGVENGKTGASGSFRLAKSDIVKKPANKTTSKKDLAKKSLKGTI